MITSQKNAIRDAIALVSGVPAIWKNDPQMLFGDCYVEISLVAGRASSYLEDLFDPEVGVKYSQVGVSTLSLLVSSQVSGYAHEAAAKIDMLLASRHPGVIDLCHTKGVTFLQTITFGPVPIPDTNGGIVEAVGITVDVAIGVSYTDTRDAAKYQISQVEISGDLTNSGLSVEVTAPEEI